jgi:DNA-binding beta-propeller fold protein YncE
MKRSLLVCIAVAGTIVPTSAPAQAPTLLSTWTAAGAYGLGRPWHFGFDVAGNVYVTDLAEHRVFAFTSSGSPEVSWNCPVLAPLDFDPQGIAVSADSRVFVTTPMPNGPPVFLLAAFTTGGGYIGPLGSIGLGDGQLGRPMDVAVDAGGNLYLADNANMRVEVLSSTGEFVTEWGSYGTAPGQFSSPLAIAVSPAGLVYVADDVSQRVEVFTTTGAFMTQWGSYGSGPGQFAGPWGIALDAAGNVYVADTSNNRIQVFTSNGQFLAQWGTLDSGPGQFYKPIGVAVGPDGRIYVADTWNSRIQVFGSMPTPTKTSSWGALKAQYR